VGYIRNAYINSIGKAKNQNFIWETRNRLDQITEMDLTDNRLWWHELHSTGSGYCARVDFFRHGYKAMDFKSVGLFKCSPYTNT
jgi:hypothetical protein